MEPELTRLDTLLDYTLEHNKEHAEDLKNLAQKAKELGKSAVHDDIIEGVEQMNKANEILGNALKRLRQ
ncbi:hypothetical protein ES703_78377 [subsurface metagenome]